MSYIYALKDPISDTVRYIGYTSGTLRKRLSDHISDANRGQRNHRCNWIRKTLSDGNKPKIELIETVSYEERISAEKYWISYFGRDNLVNGTDGGEGCKGLVVSDETRKKLSESHKGQTAWNKGVSIEVPHLDEFQFKKGSVPYNKNKKRTKETREKISKINSGVQQWMKSNSKLPYVGVTTLSDGRFRSQIGYRTKHYNIGAFELIDDAGMAYDITSIWLSGDCNRKLNFPEKRRSYILELEKTKIYNVKELRVLIRDFINKKK